MNDVQQLALVTVIGYEQEQESELEWQRFRSNIIASHPAEAKKILDVLDGNDVPEDALFAPELSEEELESYERLSHEEVEATIADLRRFGIAVS